MIYELLTGESPFPGATPSDRLAAILERDPEPPSRRRSGLSADLDAVIARTLAKDAAQRHVDGAELAADFERLRSATRESHGPTTGSRAASRWRAGIRMAVVLALALIVRPSFEAARGGTGRGAGKLPRLAVLPFEDLGPPADAYFADGMTEEIIGGLTTVHGLEVVSRTTVTQYRRAGKQLREIGRDLGVDYVLEGTVRWDSGRPGNGRVRISPQLIRVADDTHLWADDYDRDLADVFAVQTDIARQVVRALGVTLSTRERRLVEVPPTHNPEAYQLYLRGLRTMAPPALDYLGGVELMHRAGKLDPGFALAHAREARALVNNYYFGGPADNLQRARAALARAQAVAPDDPRVRLAAGWVYSQGTRDYERALLEFEAAGRAMPNNGDVPQAIGSVLRRLGRYEEALDRFARSRELGGPEDFPPWLVDLDIARTKWALRRYSQVAPFYDERLRFAPDRFEIWRDRAVLQLQWTGDTAAARAVLADAPPTTEAGLVETRVLIELWDRHFATAASLGQPHLDPRQIRALEWYVAYAELRQGRLHEGADLARRLVTAREASLATSPDSFPLHQDLAETYALLGARVPAMAHARKAIALTADDAYLGPQMVESLAFVHTQLGDREQALALLSGLLEKAYHTPLDSARLQGEPWWDPLRGDPRFEQLLARAGAVSPGR